MPDKINSPVDVALVEMPIDLFITLCRIIRKTHIEADTGGVWRSLQNDNGHPAPAGCFYMGIGQTPDHPLFFLIPLNRWEETYFAKELATAPPFTLFPTSARVEKIREMLSNFLG